ncbi:MAG: histidinol-phosphate transaminase [Bacteroidales bacterium]|jgi:histidinol-phosphate aminotransferase|nr:histidinol-phosphate transaminase [Bacteroidales bacterium]
MSDLDKLVRPNVLSLTPYSCARDEFQGNEGIFLDANENPFGTLNRYPDPYQKELKNVISNIKGVPAKNIFLGNGSDEIIDLCFRIFCRPGTDRALTFTPTYGMYEVSAAVNDVGIIKLPLNKNFQIDIDTLNPFFSDENLKLILICSPNNPTGNCMNRAGLETILARFNGIVLLDEAYNDFADEPSFTDEISRYPNLIVMQTFSKAYGMASVRVGMAFANHGIIRYFNKMKPPYNISTVNQKTVLQNLKKQKRLKEQVSKIKDERMRLAENLKNLSFVKHVYPSDANFLLVQVSDAGYIYNYLIERKIIVRNRSSIINNCLRITVGTKTENNKLMNALEKIKI